MSEDEDMYTERCSVCGRTFNSLDEGEGDDSGVWICGRSQCIEQAAAADRMAEQDAA